MNSKRLHELFIRLFDEASALRAFIKGGPEGQEIEAGLPEGLSRADLVDEYMAAIERKGVEPRELFDSLLEEKPAHGEEIRAAQTADDGDRQERRAAAAELERLIRRRRDQHEAGSVAELDAEILRLKRILRVGPTLKEGEILNGVFQLKEKVGTGGFATVWRAWELLAGGLHREVAVKVLRGEYSEDRTKRDRMFRGARLMYSLEHPAVVKVLKTRAEDVGFRYYVMEYLAGGNLRTAVLEKRLNYEEALDLLQQVGDGLQAAHDRGMVHRDVKPSNILLDGARAAKLSDFDLVRAPMTRAFTVPGGVLGTVAFAAPESLKGSEQAGVPADVFSLAMTAAFCVWGAPLPWPDTIRDPSAFVDGLNCSDALREVLRQGLAFDPHARFASVRALCEAMADALEAEATEQLLRDSYAEATTDGTGIAKEARSAEHVELWPNWQPEPLPTFEPRGGDEPDTLPSSLEPILARGRLEALDAELLRIPAPPVAEALDEAETRIRLQPSGPVDEEQRVRILVPFSNSGAPDSLLAADGPSADDSDIGQEIPPDTQTGFRTWRMLTIAALLAVLPIAFLAFLWNLWNLADTVLALVGPVPSQPVMVQGTPAAQIPHPITGLQEAWMSEEEGSIVVPVAAAPLADLEPHAPSMGGADKGELEERPEPAPVTESPEPASSGLGLCVPKPGPGLDIRGLWIGAADGRSFKLTIRSQSKASVSGMAEMNQDDGTWEKYQVTGFVDDRGAVCLGTEGQVELRGSLRGMRLNGTYVLGSDSRPKNFSLIR
ncbi:MAG: serine/threonine protein kinase [Myxococcales bacterium]|nr:serine/threonine protein kinase [Myxococcales bacterium]